MEFCTKYNRPEKQLDAIGGEILIEIAGYVSAQERITNLILAGERLVAGRAERFDFEGDIDDIPEEYEDPTREKNFDQVDADRLLRKAQDGLRQSAKAAQQAAEKKPAQAPEGASEGGKKGDPGE